MKKVILLSLLCIIFFSSYAQKDGMFALETINNIVDEIDGGSCYFSTTISNYSEDKFVFVNDFAYYACVQINKETFLLELLEYNKEEEKFIYSSKKNDLVIEVMILKKETMDFQIIKLNYSINNVNFEYFLYGKCID